MRSSKSRSRSKQNRPRSIGNIVNRVFESSGPEGKVRGTPQQIIEKYQTLARDAQLSNDRVAAENFLQHAEHYTRMLGEAMREMAAEQDQRRPAQGGNGNGQPQQGGQDRQGYAPRRDDRDDDQPDVGPVPVFGFADGGDDADSGLVETPEARQDPPPRPAQQPQQNQRSDRRDGNRQGDGQRGPRADQNRPDQNRADQNRADQNRPDQPRPDQPRADQPRRDRDDRPRREDRPRRDDTRPAADAPATEASAAEPAKPVATPAPRPPTPVAAAPVPEPVAVPPVAVAPPQPVAAPDEAEAKPRRPRAPRKPKAPAPATSGDDSAAAE